MLEDTPDDKDQLPHIPCYKQKQINTIRYMYICATILWLVAIAFMGILPPRDWIELLILFIPIIVFAISYSQLDCITEKVEGYMFRANLLTLGLLISLPLLTWIHENSHENRLMFIRLSSAAIILSVLTLVDIWVCPKYLPLVRHIRSVFQTFALTFFIFVLYRFFIEKANNCALSMPNLLPLGYGAVPPAQI